MEDNLGQADQYIFNEMFFDENELRTRIKTFCRAELLNETTDALNYAYEMHKGQFRKQVKGSERKMPYIIHPMTMCAQAHACGICDDVLLAAILLHDVVEDTDAEIESLPFSKEVKDLVGLLTFEQKDGMSREEARMYYFGKISSDPRARVVKLLDRCNNVATMAACFDREKLEKYIAETEKYVLPFADMLYRLNPEYEKVAFQTKYQIMSVIETIKTLL